MMKKILFITRSYPRFRGSATVLCTQRIMEACAQDSDLEVHCMCAKYDDESCSEILNRVHVHRYKRTPWTRLYDSAEKRRSLQHRLLQIQKFLTLPIYPCINPFELYKGYHFAKKLHTIEHFDAIVSEHHCHESVHIGLWMKHDNPSIKFYPVLWDPILGGTPSPLLPKEFSFKRTKSFEDDVNSCADNVFSIQAAKRIYSKYEDSSHGKRIYIDIPSVLPLEQEVGSSYLPLLEKDHINIVFSGIVGAPTRDPNPIIELLNNTTAASRINLIFLCRGFNVNDKKRWSEEFKGNLVVHDYIPLNELHTIYRHADYLLNISHTNAEMTPSKIFEYMSYGKPIISTFVTDGDSAKTYLDKYPESSVIDLKMDKEQNIQKLNEFIGKPHAVISYEEVKNIFPLNTPEEFTKILKKKI